MTMVAKRRLVWESSGDKTALTLDDLAAFVQAAMRDGLPGDTPIHGRVTGWAARLKRVEAVGMDEVKADTR